MAFTKITKEDLIQEDRGNGKLLEDGWYQLAVQKVEARQSKATQDMLSLTYGVCAEESNPDSVTGGRLFDIVMFPSWDDDAAFAQSIADKKGLDGDDLEAEVNKRRQMAQNGAANFAFAIFGYDDFSPVPRKTEEGTYALPDGTEIKNAGDRAAMYDQRKTEAFNAATEIATGERDVSRYLVYGKVVTDSYNGNERNSVKTVKCYLPAGETLKTP